MSSFSSDPEMILALARTSGIKIATAESCTGGMIAARLTDIAGSSDVFERGFVTYSNDAKIGMLSVLSETLEAKGAVSEEVAQEMAMGALTNSSANLALSVTGIAGPGGSEFKPEGRVCFGIAGSALSPKTETVEFGALGRSVVRQQATDHALRLLCSALQTYDA